jgi:GntR family transcriptional regulator / MocR family aminotransferase
VQALKSHFGENAIILGEKAGLHIMVKLKTHLNDDEIIQRAAKVGVGMMSASKHYLNSSSSSEFIFGYGELNEQQLVEGIRRLGEILSK